jgi:hypothetical protein
VHTGVAPNDGVEQFPPLAVSVCATGAPPLMLIEIDCVAAERYAGRRFNAEEATAGASMRIVTLTEAGETGGAPAGRTDAPPPPQPASAIATMQNATSGNTKRSFP